MNDSSENQLITDVARDLVSAMAPEELPIFRANSEAYFKDPEKVLASQTPKDDMLGFGAGEAAVFLTPIILAIITDVVKFVAEELKKSAQVEGSAMINDAVKAMFNKFRPPEKEEKKKPPPLTAEQLAQVRAIAIKKARQLNLSEERAKILADSVVGGLATA